MTIQTPKPHIANLKEIESFGFGITGYVGGLPKQTYYTPDGRSFQAFPQIRDFQKLNSEGKIIATGQRDANLDKGWLLSMPTVLKIHCLFCDGYHDNQTQVDACEVVAKKEKAERQVIIDAEVAADKAERESEFNKQIKERDNKIGLLESQLAKLTSMVEGMMKKEKPDGKIL
jgi:hypothetical protein